MDEMERLRRATDELVAFCDRIDQQLREHGIRGVPDVVDSFGRITSALEDVRQQDLDRGLIDAGHLLDRLRLLGGRLESLGEMKRILLGADLEAV